MLQNDRSLATPELEYQVLLFHANACYQERQLRMAIKQLNAALLMRKFMCRYKSSHLTAIESAYEHFNETETRYRLAKCHQDLAETSQAISVLQALPAKARTPKVNLFLAKLIQIFGGTNGAEAILNYKEVLRECPMALEAIDALLELGVDGIEVNSLVVNGKLLLYSYFQINEMISYYSQYCTQKY